jgi:hypothetical protein
VARMSRSAPDPFVLSGQAIARGQGDDRARRGPDPGPAGYEPGAMAGAAGDAARAGRWFGRVIGSSRERLRAAAEQWEVRRLPNVGGCPVT